MYPPFKWQNFLHSRVTVNNF